MTNRKPTPATADDDLTLLNLTAAQQRYLYLLHRAIPAAEHALQFLDTAVAATPTGKARNLMCDAKVTVQQAIDAAYQQASRDAKRPPPNSRPPSMTG